MHTIWKYDLSPGNLEVQMPRGAKLRHVGNQNEILTLWAQVDTEAPLVTRLLPVHGTGHQIHTLNRGDGPELPRYVGSALMYNGMLVLHVFDHGEI